MPVSGNGRFVASRFHLMPVVVRLAAGIVRYARAPLLVGTVALALAGCASPNVVSQSPRLGGPGAYDPRLGVTASEKLIADDQPVPHGGGYYIVGKPYVIAGKTYYPSDKPYRGVGVGSWYGIAFRGRKTANGEIFDTASLSAAHPTMPLPSYARVTNLANDRSVIVRVNDRGPYHDNRVMDASEKVAEVLDYKRRGTTKLKVEYIGRAALAGSNDDKLLATLRTDGSRAALDRSADEGPVNDARTEPLSYPPPEPRVAMALPRDAERRASRSGRGESRIRERERETIAEIAAAPLPEEREPRARDAKKGRTVASMARRKDEDDDGDAPKRKRRPRVLEYASGSTLAQQLGRRGPFAGLKPQSFRRIDRPLPAD